MSKKVKTILLIDDDTVNNFIVINTLKKLDCAENIISTLNGSEALDFINSRIENNETDLPDLILLDINMPVLDGWEFMEIYQQIHEKYRSKMKIYMVSSSVYEEDILKARKYEDIQDFISKPLERQRLEKIFAEL